MNNPQTDKAIPVQIIVPWLVDNEAFIKELKNRSSTLERASDIRAGLSLRKMDVVEPCALEAIDAAVTEVSIGDLITILVQTVRVTAKEDVICSAPLRVSGVNSQELSLLRTPLRMVEECAVLAQSKLITIADTSFWSMLMEVNQLITFFHNGGAQIPELAHAYDILIRAGIFLEMLRNSAVIAMSKHNQSCKVGGNKMVSDRELLGRALEPGEFTEPEDLATTTSGHFGVEKRGFNDAERQEIKRIYDFILGVTFFKPHSWSRAFRIEAHLSNLCDDKWLMPLLNAITEGTRARTCEPWPQFIADYATKRISAVTKLYGDSNISRVPYFDPVRTIR
jgi:hypothetical protein